MFVRPSNRHSVYGLGKVSEYRRAPIVAGVSSDKRSVGTSTNRICIVCIRGWRCRLDDVFEYKDLSTRASSSFVLGTGTRMYVPGM